VIRIRFSQTHIRRTNDVTSIENSFCCLQRNPDFRQRPICHGQIAKETRKTTPCCYSWLPVLVWKKNKKADSYQVKCTMSLIDMSIWSHMASRKETRNTAMYTQHWAGKKNTQTKQKNNAFDYHTTLSLQYLVHIRIWFWPKEKRVKSTADKTHVTKTHLKQIDPKEPIMWWSRTQTCNITRRRQDTSIRAQISCDRIHSRRDATLSCSICAVLIVLGGFCRKNLLIQWISPLPAPSSTMHHWFPGHPSSPWVAPIWFQVWWCDRLALRGGPYAERALTQPPF